jgi:hypothetical protein
VIGGKRPGTDLGHPDQHHQGTPLLVYLSGQFTATIDAARRAALATAAETLIAQNRTTVVFGPLTMSGRRCGAGDLDRGLWAEVSGGAAGELGGEAGCRRRGIGWPRRSARTHAVRPAVSSWSTQVALSVPRAPSWARLSPPFRVGAAPIGSGRTVTSIMRTSVRRPGVESADLDEGRHRRQQYVLRVVAADAREAERHIVEQSVQRYGPWKDLPVYRQDTQLAA